MADVASEGGGVEGRELEGELVKDMQGLDLTDNAERLRSVSPKAATDEEAAVADDDSRGGPWPPSGSAGDQEHWASAWDYEYNQWSSEKSGRSAC